MATDIIMPQMGESIVEGTITKWLKKPGDKIQRDEPLFEISTDKVDAEIPAPASGVLEEIKVSEGTTVQVNTVVGTIATDGAAAKPAAEKKPEQPPAAPPRAESPAPKTQPAAAPAPASHEEDEHARSSPLVRRIAREHNVDLSRVEGTGLGGRITKQDILGFIENQGGTATEPGFAGVSPAEAPPPAYEPPLSAPGPAAPSAPRPAPAAIPGDLVPMTNMRRIIAQRMVESRRTSAHVHAMFEVDMTRIVNLRNKLKSSFEQRHGLR
ncbi:MAG: E3 binding domain-containing protein, partial [Acidobacteria bacterium]|nr:E3 binding domain-containing protein [Acidobacteriota bacterium]